MLGWWDVRGAAAEGNHMLSPQKSETQQAHLSIDTPKN